MQDKVEEGEKAYFYCRIVFEEEDLPNVMRHGEDCPPVQENLDDLVVVRVGRQDERGDVRGEVGRVRGYCLPAL